MLSKYDKIGQTHLSGFKVVWAKEAYYVTKQKVNTKQILLISMHFINVESLAFTYSKCD